MMTGKVVYRLLPVTDRSTKVRSNIKVQRSSLNTVVFIQTGTIEALAECIAASLTGKQGCKNIFGLSHKLDFSRNGINKDLCILHC